MVGKIEDRNMALKKVHKSQLEGAINNLFKAGKKKGAERVVFEALYQLKKETKTSPTLSLESAVDNACPVVQLKRKKVGGISYKIPIHLIEKKRSSLGLKLLVQSSCGRKLGPRLALFSREILLASRGKGQAIQRKNALHNLAVLNRAYIKFL